MTRREAATWSPGMIWQALLLSVLMIGGMGTGLGLTTYSVAKANELVFGDASSVHECRA